jgi:hypothetical protein
VEELLWRVVLKQYDQLTTGWNEKVEFVEIIDGIKYHRSVYARQDSLISQLSREIAQVRNIKHSEDKKANKSQSSAPGKTEALHLIEDIDASVKEATANLRLVIGLFKVQTFGFYGLVEMAANRDATPQSAAILLEIREAFRTHIKAARIMLGYDVRRKALPDTPCGQCAGVLVVAEDSDSDVQCVSCGHRYRRHEWVRLLSRISGLVDTVTAVAYTGRPVGTLYRWKSEGRVTAYAAAGTRGTPRWDLAELPQYVPGEPMPAAPHLPRTRARMALPTQHHVEH